MCGSHPKRLRRLLASDWQRVPEGPRYVASRYVAQSCLAGNRHLHGRVARSCFALPQHAPNEDPRVFLCDREYARVLVSAFPRIAASAGTESARARRVYASSDVTTALCGGHAPQRSAVGRRIGTYELSQYIGCDRTTAPHNQPL